MNHAYKEPLIVQEVAPRDGLQIEKHWVETEDKIALIDATLGVRLHAYRSGLVRVAQGDSRTARRRRGVQRHPARSRA